MVDQAFVSILLLHSPTSSDEGLLAIPTQTIGLLFQSILPSQRIGQTDFSFSFLHSFVLHLKKVIKDYDLQLVHDFSCSYSMATFFTTPLCPRVLCNIFIVQKYMV
eukprot:Gregarina_sp_Poly_1__2490@NODE_1675_length_3552_cov_321_088379_g1101_i0_p3_GENE_NODE_1675_length_3552_cov_321_088379_g1101_i0NODE_1675_length_3552_cov_321_088379_g1101_i0_p3_ORF_typecomplete_len106_score4_79Nup54_57_C/PF18570_1/0_34_NODE_1675_length_3552_cov_321_088379_g1101_i0555872